ncbi:DUF930 domain-containing protein [Rhizobiaceae bacterium BDR2-2]|uniref:DUF930 domain-containing protein n=1 Tax=Ectorhizobium quercum TaxID=2965071 RepID=A0AAE3SWH0_9HYPH|nr:DUF930 domain-containing protein [Ectorhizobium quercum]MCX8998019.1 DUF930 domain-containing protein [Ectorhizobium quercum]
MRAALSGGPPGGPFAPPGNRRLSLRLLVVSLLVHVGALALLAMLATIDPLQEEPEEPIAVTLFPADPRSAPPVSTRPISPESAAPEQPADPPAAAEDDMIAATRFRAAEVLSDPRSASAREALQTLAPETRLEQLCNLEVMEQVRLWKPDLAPDFVIAYATTDTRLRGRELTAEGAAVRISGRWFRLRYACTGSGDLAAVTRLAFSLGAEIPEAEWSEHGLPAGDAEMHE